MFEAESPMSYSLAGVMRSIEDFILPGLAASTFLFIKLILSTSLSSSSILITFLARSLSLTGEAVEDLTGSSG